MSLIIFDKRFGFKVTQTKNYYSDNYTSQFLKTIYLKGKIVNF